MFKIKDLMIKILPEESICNPGSRTCEYTCYCGTACTASAFAPPVCLVQTIPPIPMHMAQSASDPQAQLASLKEQLQFALKQVEEQEKFIDEQLRPKTIEEIEQLEAKLLEALEELKKQKEDLKKRKK